MKKIIILIFLININASDDNASDDNASDYEASIFCNVTVRKTELKIIQVEKKFKSSLKNNKELPNKFNKIQKNISLAKINLKEYYKTEQNIFEEELKTKLLEQEKRESPSKSLKKREKDKERKKKYKQKCTEKKKRENEDNIVCKKKLEEVCNFLEKSKFMFHLKTVMIMYGINVKTDSELYANEEDKEIIKEGLDFYHKKMNLIPSKLSLSIVSLHYIRLFGEKEEIINLVKRLRELVILFVSFQKGQDKFEGMPYFKKCLSEFHDNITIYKLNE